MIQCLDCPKLIERVRKGASGRCRKCNDAFRSKSKICPRCKVAEIPGGNRVPAYCRQCINEYNRERPINQQRKSEVRRQELHRRYGLTPEMYDAINAAQNGLCRICSRSQKSGRRLDVDHSHQTGKFRGLLCSNCNTALGLLQEDPAIIQALLKYIQEV